MLQGPQAGPGSVCLTPELWAGLTLGLAPAPLAYGAMPGPSHMGLRLSSQGYRAASGSVAGTLVSSSFARYELSLSKSSPPSRIALSFYSLTPGSQSPCRSTFVGCKKSGCVSCSVVLDSATLWTVACRAPLSMGFSRQEH